MRQLLPHSLVVAAVPVLGALVVPLSAQDSALVVPNAVACGTCSLDVSVVVELGDADGPGIVTDYVFRIGRTGEGPGEYRSPVLMRGSGENLRVLDMQTARVTTIRDDEITTSMLPFMPGDWASLPDGRDVFFALTYEPERAGHPLHVYDEGSRRITRSFGSDGVPADRSYESRMASQRRIAPAADGNVWAARVNRYRIDKWSPDGAHIMRIDRDAPWFRPWARSPGLPREVEPLPFIVGVRDWGDGLLMVVLSVADDNWQPMPPARVIGTETLTSSAQREDLYDTVIEVLDTRSGRVLARTRVDANAIGLIGRDGLYSYAEHSGGEPKFVVWSVSLSGVREGRR